MSKKNELKDLILWGSESNENKKKAIEAFTFAISTLNASEKKLSEKELEDTAAGYETWHDIPIG